MVYSSDSPHYWFVQSALSWITNKDEFSNALADSSYPKPANNNIRWADVRNMQWSMCDPYRHGGYASYSFIDGHAEKLKANQDTYDLLKKRWDRLN
jgi:prepilin-type processing-associated H-X9-DG protein